jgi:transposase-like protein
MSNQDSKTDTESILRQELSEENFKKVWNKINKQNIRSLSDLTKAGGPLQEFFKGAVETLLNEEMKDHLGYAHSDTTQKATENSRNGYYNKKIKTEGGEVELKIPRDRKGEFEPQIIPKYTTKTSELENQIISMYAKGMTTTDISSHLKDLYMGVEVSPTFISKVTEKVLQLSTEWQNRHLKEVYPIVYLDAIHFKVRDSGKILSKAAYICLGIDSEGIRDVLGIFIGENESASFWLSVLTDLQNRGVKDILIACIDGLKGFPDAIKTIFPKTEVQLCIIHQIRNSLKYVGSKHQKEFMSDLKPVYQAPTKELAEEKLKSLDEKWGSKYPVVINSWQKNWEALSTFFRFSPPIRTIIYTTNIVEGYHRQLRKVTKNRSVFPHDHALFKLLYLATMEAKKKWDLPKRDWAEIFSQLAIHFDGRLSLSLI